MHVKQQITGPVAIVIVLVVVILIVAVGYFAFMRKSGVSAGQEADDLEAQEQQMQQGEAGPAQEGGGEGDSPHAI